MVLQRDGVVIHELLQDFGRLAEAHQSPVALPSVGYKTGVITIYPNMNWLQLAILPVVICYFNIMMAATALREEMLNPVLDDHAIFANLDDIPEGNLEPKRRRIAEDHSDVIDSNPDSPNSSADSFDTLMSSSLSGFSDHPHNPGSTVDRESWEMDTPHKTEAHRVPSSWGSGGSTKASIEAQGEMIQALREHFRQSKVLVEAKQRSQRNSGISRSTNERTGFNWPKDPIPLKDEVGFEENQFTTTGERKRPYGSTRDQSQVRVRFGGLSMDMITGSKSKTIWRSDDLDSLEGKHVSFRLPFPNRIGGANRRADSLSNRIRKIRNKLDDLYSISNMENPTKKELLEIENPRKSLLDWYDDLIFTNTEDHQPLLGSGPFNGEKNFNEAQKAMHWALTSSKKLNQEEATKIAQFLLGRYNKSTA
ncbi:hypothetical protein PSTT_01467 [Puccinia striiformis]|uniref:Uncharacterized protein n=1 Tax=Puccinia striiformis TaxID=27350 RepID=A0A2S4W3J1_9BASI|nr:hypothetical protein PSTT_01467 [Puccinia striiformis]